MTYPAKVVPQLDGTVWGPWSCDYATAARQVAFSSGGRIRPTSIEMRKRAGQWLAHPSAQQLANMGPANLDDQKRAIESFAPEFAKIGLQAPRMRLLGATTPAVVRAYLVQGASVSVQIGYHVINHQRPRASGDPGFNTPGHDGHAIAVQGLYTPDGKPVPAGTPWHGVNLTDDEDPLCDGRRKGIARGPQRLPLSVIFAAAAELPISSNGHTLGRGLVLAAVVREALPIVVPPPPPPPPPVETDAQKIARLTREIAAAKTDLAACNLHSGATDARAAQAESALRALAAAAQDANNPALSDLATQIANDYAGGIEL